MAASRIGSYIWGKFLPMDFTAEDCRGVEQKTRLLHHQDDARAYRGEVNRGLSSSLADLALRQAQLGARQNTNNPDMVDRVVPFVRNVMLSEKATSLSSQESFLLALRRLAEGVSAQEQKHAKKPIGAMDGGVAMTRWRRANGIFDLWPRDAEY